MIVTRVNRVGRIPRDHDLVLGAGLPLLAQESSNALGDFARRRIASRRFKCAPYLARGKSPYQPCKIPHGVWVRSSDLGKDAPNGRLYTWFLRQYWSSNAGHR